MLRTISVIGFIALQCSAASAQLTVGRGPNAVAPGCTTPSGAPNCRNPANMSGGVVDILDYSSFAAAVATGKAIRFPANSSTQANNIGYMVVSNDLIFEPGATLGCSGDLQLALTGTITAPPDTIFSACTPSFFAQTGKVSVGYPEWWGASGDYGGGGSGTGTDNTVPIQNAINSGIGVLQFGAHASYRITGTLNVRLNNFQMIGYGWGESHLILDDATGTKDAIWESGNNIGNFEFSKLDVHRLQQATGYARWAYSYAGGIGVVPGDTFTSFGGTASTAAVVTSITTQVTVATLVNAGSGARPAPKRSRARRGRVRNFKRR